MNLRQKSVPVAKIEMKDERTRNKSVDKPKSEGGSYDSKAYSEKS